MDVNFDDIFQEFERDVRPDELNLVEFKRKDLAELTQAWISERMSPELLEYKGTLVEKLLMRVRKQIEFIEINSIELQTQEKDIKLHLMIVESELDRINFLLRSYLRTRLSKIDKYTVFIRNNEEVLRRLSPKETEYMEAHFAALVQLYNSEFLSSLPEQLQALDDTGGGISMVEEFEMDKPVFFKVVEDILEPIVVADEEIELLAGSIYLLRYSAIRKFVKTGEVLLI